VKMRSTWSRAPNPISGDLIERENLNTDPQRVHDDVRTWLSTATGGPGAGPPHILWEEPALQYLKVLDFWAPEPRQHMPVFQSHLGASKALCDNSLGNYRPRSWASPSLSSGFLLPSFEGSLEQEVRSLVFPTMLHSSLGIPRRIPRS
jgi:hypothetical protein